MNNILFFCQKTIDKRKVLVYNKGVPERKGNRTEANSLKNIFSKRVDKIKKVRYNIGTVKGERKVTPLLNKKLCVHYIVWEKGRNMTNREFLEAIRSNSTLSAELIEFAAAAIAKLDKRNADRSSKPSKTAIANEPIKTAIVEFLNKEGFIATAADIAANCNITTQKASALCRQMVEAGAVRSTEVKIPKKGKCKAYSLAPVQVGE